MPRFRVNRLAVR